LLTALAPLLNQLLASGVVGGGGRQSGSARRGGARRGGARRGALDASADIDVLKVSSQSDPKLVAGKLANTFRDGAQELTLLASGSTSVNQAIKAFAITGDYLANDATPSQICVAAEFQDRSDYRIKFTLSPSRFNTHIENVTDLKVSAESDPNAVAGAVANMLREGKRVAAMAIGPLAVNTATVAMAKARSYLQDDKITLMFRPEFVKMDLADGERSGICFNVLV